MGGETEGVGVGLSTCFLLHHLIVGYSNSAHSAHAALKHLLIMIYVISCKKRCLLSSAGEGKAQKQKALPTFQGRQARSKAKQIELCCKLFVYFVAVAVVVAVVIALVFGH